MFSRKFSRISWFGGGIKIKAYFIIINIIIIVVLLLNYRCPEAWRKKIVSISF